MTELDKKEWLKKAFTNFMENINATDDVYAQYFSKDYMQYVDGKVTNYHGLISRIKAMKVGKKLIKVTFKDILVEGNKIATVFSIQKIKENGSEENEIKIALFTVKDSQFIACNELSYFIPQDEKTRPI